jgi:outer membrane receptor protein involved in Fe transport
VKSGGYTAYNSPYQNQIDAFQPEVLYAYELGFKGDISRAFRLNVAGFYDYRNQQVLGTVLSEQTGLIGRITNAPKSRIYGAEAEVVVTPVKGLRITQSGSYKGGEYIRYDAVDPNSLQGSAGSYSASRSAMPDNRCRSRTGAIRAASPRRSPPGITSSKRQATMPGARNCPRSLAQRMTCPRAGSSTPT